MTPPTVPAIVLCEGKFRSTDGKTAHGLVRYSEVYRILAVIDSSAAGEDAGALLDGSPNGISIVASLDEAIARAAEPPRLLILGVATDGGRIPAPFFPVIRRAIAHGMSVMSGLHEELASHPDIVALARERGVTLTDVRRALPKEDSHFFTGKIDEVTCPVIAVLGTDSAIGKRTTARVLVKALNDAGYRAVFVGTGQTGRMQGGRYSIILDSIVNDFVTGEIEHVVHEAWRLEDPDLIVVEGQGSVTHPAYPGGYEIIAGARVKGVVLQHAPGRACRDGFPQYPMPDPRREIAIVEAQSEHPVFAVTLNHEGLTRDEAREWAERFEKETGKTVTDVLWDGPHRLVQATVRQFGLRKRVALAPAA